MKSTFEELSKALNLCSINISYYFSKSTGRIVLSEMHHSGCQGLEGGRKEE